MSKSKVVCDNPECCKEFWKENKELNRSRKLGRKQYCCQSCYGIAEGKNNLDNISPQKRKELQKNVARYCRNRRDEYTPFRFFFKVINNNNRSKKKGDIDLTYLKELWEEQKGVCPLTGWKLVLPDSVEGWKTYRNGKRASLDRIDNKKGYVEGNVRFISFMANIARCDMSDKELIKFCKAVTLNRK